MRVNNYGSQPANGGLPSLSGSEFLSQVKEFKYLRVLFSNGKVECEMNRWFGVLQALHWTVLVKRELINVAKMSFHQGVAGLSQAFTSKGARWVDSVICLECLLGASLEVFQAQPTGRRAEGRPRACWGDCISSLAWECLGFPQMLIVCVQLITMTCGKYEHEELPISSEVLEVSGAACFSLVSRLNLDEDQLHYATTNTLKMQMFLDSLA